MRIVGWILALGFGWLAYSIMHEDRARYRITYTIETPSGDKSGSHVLETWRGFGGGAVGRYSYGARGEAAVIDLGDGKFLLALLAFGPKGEGVDGPIRLPSAVYAEELRRLCNHWSAGEACDVRDFAASNFPARELEAPFIPTIVNFTDFNNPASAQVIYATGRRFSECNPKPGESCQPRDIGPLVIDNFASTYGPGYGFKRATLEMVPVGIWPLNLIGITGTPITRGLEEKVAFLTTHREPSRRVIRDMLPKFRTGFSQFIRE
jgi:hypothetical protein